MITKEEVKNINKQTEDIYKIYKTTLACCLVFCGRDNEEIHVSGQKLMITKISWKKKKKLNVFFLIPLKSLHIHTVERTPSQLPVFHSSLRRFLISTLSFFLMHIKSYELSATVCKITKLRTCLLIVYSIL